MRLLLILCAIARMATAASPGAMMMNMATITDLDVLCDKSGMTVTIEFSHPFNGIIFSKGFYSNPECRYVGENSGSRTYTFRLNSHKCGTGYELEPKQSMHNTIVVQFDPLVQEVWDTARRLSCTWRNAYSKMIKFEPFRVSMLDVVRTHFRGEELRCWMDIRRGVFPNTRPLDEVLPIGEAVSVMVFLEDPEKRMDVAVRDCWAQPTSDFSNPNAIRIQLSSVEGCPINKKIMGEWQSTYERLDTGITLVTYSTLSAFKFPDHSQIFLTCNVEICQNECERSCNSNPTTPIDIVIPPPTTSRSIINLSECFPGSTDPKCRKPNHVNWCKTFTNHPKCRIPNQNIEVPSEICKEGSTDPRCFNSIENNFKCFEGSNDPRCVKTGKELLICKPGSKDPRCIEESFSFKCLPGSQDPRCLKPNILIIDCSIDIFHPSCQNTIFDCSKNPRNPRCLEIKTNKVLCIDGSSHPSCRKKFQPNQNKKIIITKNCETHPHDPQCIREKVRKVPEVKINLPKEPHKILCSLGSRDPLCNIPPIIPNCELNPFHSDCVIQPVTESFRSLERCHIGSNDPKCKQSHRESTFQTEPTLRPSLTINTTPFQKNILKFDCKNNPKHPNCHQPLELIPKEQRCGPDSNNPRCIQIPRVQQPPNLEPIFKQISKEKIKTQKSLQPFIKTSNKNIFLCKENSNDPRCKTNIKPKVLNCQTNPSDINCLPNIPKLPQKEIEDTIDCLEDVNHPSCKIKPIDCLRDINHPSCKIKPNIILCALAPNHPTCEKINNACLPGSKDKRCIRLFENKPCDPKSNDPKCRPFFPKDNLDCLNNPDDPRCRQTSIEITPNIDEIPFIDEKLTINEEEIPLPDERKPPPVNIIPPFVDNERKSIETVSPIVQEKHPFIIVKHENTEEIHPNIDEQSPIIEEKTAINTDKPHIIQENIPPSNLKTHIDKSVPFIDFEKDKQLQKISKKKVIENNRCLFNAKDPSCLKKHLPKPPKCFPGSTDPICKPPLECILGSKSSICHNWKKEIDTILTTQREDWSSRLTTPTTTERIPITKSILTTKKPPEQKTTTKVLIENPIEPKKIPKTILIEEKELKKPQNKNFVPRRPSPSLQKSLDKSSPFIPDIETEITKNNIIPEFPPVLPKDLVTERSRTPKSKTATTSFISLQTTTPRTTIRKTITPKIETLTTTAFKTTTPKSTTAATRRITPRRRTPSRRRTTTRRTPTRTRTTTRAQTSPITTERSIPTKKIFTTRRTPTRTTINRRTPTRRTTETIRTPTTRAPTTRTSTTRTPTTRTPTTRTPTTRALTTRTSTTRTTTTRPSTIRALTSRAPTTRTSTTRNPTTRNPTTRTRTTRTRTTRTPTTRRTTTARIPTTRTTTERSITRRSTTTTRTPSRRASTTTRTPKRRTTTTTRTPKRRTTTTTRIPKKRTSTTTRTPTRTTTTTTRTPTKRTTTTTRTPTRRTTTTTRTPTRRTTTTRRTPTKRTTTTTRTPTRRTTTTTRTPTRRTTTTARSQTRRTTTSRSTPARRLTTTRRTPTRTTTTIRTPTRGITTTERTSRIRTPATRRTPTRRIPPRRHTTTSRPKVSNIKQTRPKIRIKTTTTFKPTEITPPPVPITVNNPFKPTTRIIPINEVSTTSKPLITNKFVRPNIEIQSITEKIFTTAKPFSSRKISKEVSKFPPFPGTNRIRFRPSTSRTVSVPKVTPSPKKNKEIPDRKSNRGKEIGIRDFTIPSQIKTENLIPIITTETSQRKLVTPKKSTPSTFPPFILPFTPEIIEVVKKTTTIRPTTLGKSTTTLRTIDKTNRKIPKKPQISKGKQIISRDPTEKPKKTPTRRPSVTQKTMERHHGKKMMHGKDDHHGKHMDPRYHAFHSWLYQPAPRPRKRGKRAIPSTSVLVSVGGKSLTVVDDDQGKRDDNQLQVPILIMEDSVPRNDVEYLQSDFEAFVEEVPINDDYDFLTYQSMEQDNLFRIKNNSFVTYTILEVVMIFFSILIILSFVTVLILSTRMVTKRSKKTIPHTF